MTDLTLIPPKSIWKRTVKFESRGLMSALGKFVVDRATGASEDAAKDLIDAAGALGLAREPDELAGLLIQRALMRAVSDLIDDYRRDFPEQLGDFGPEIADFMHAREYTIDERFFADPRDSTIVREFQRVFEQWLKFVNLRGHVAETVAARLPARFVYALHREHIQHRGDYARLFEGLDGKFTGAWQRERSWEEYHRYVVSSLVDSVFGEDFGLEQIFQWPRAYFLQQHSNVGRRGEVALASERVVMLREALDGWIQLANSDDAVRVISGDPGAGKSSFTKMYASHRLAKEDRVLHIPLHMLNVTDDLYNAINLLCAATPPFPVEPFAGDHPLLLILDGLDELSKTGRSGAQLAHEFAGHVQQIVRARNQGRLRLRVILSGRPIAAQDLASDFRTTGQILHLLPYAVPVSRYYRRRWHDPDNLLAVDQRHLWWRRYGELTKRDYLGLPHALSGESLFETTTQPLLGYLLALVHRDALASGRTIDKDVTHNEIYERLLQSIYKRDYDKLAGGHDSVRGLSQGEFEELLEEMALTAWRQDARVVSVKAFEEQCARSNLSDVLDRYKRRAQAGIGKLFTAFYFRRHGIAGGDETFEFTHKSFAEYLVARRFVAELMAAVTHLSERSASRGRHARGKSVSMVLLDWVEVFGPTPITTDIVVYLETEVRRHAVRDVEVWQDALLLMIEEVLHGGVPCERVAPVLPFCQMLRWSANAELALLVMLRCCSWVTGRLSELAWPHPRACGEWLMRLRASNRETPILLGLISLRGQVLSNIDLENADLAGANLMNAKMGHAKLVGADLTGADLMNAKLMFADLTGAFLVSSNIMNVDFSNADFSNADFSDADLTEACIQGSNITPEQLAAADGDPRIVT